MRAEHFAPLPEELRERWASFPFSGERTFFPALVGLTLEEVRTDYCRMSLPYRPELDQPAGVVHGGAVATLLDTVVVPAIGQAYGRDDFYATVSMSISFTGAMVGTDAVAEGWVTRRGRSIVFCSAEAVSNERVIASAQLVYTVKPAR